MLKIAVDGSFNSISVDGDTSTNDTVLLLASGKLGNAAERRSRRLPARAGHAICRDLAWMIVRDGEGAIRVMELEVTGAKTDRDAKLAAHAIATSPLVKTALHGGDPNWGRILAAVGRSGARFSLKKISLHAGTDRPRPQRRARAPTARKTPRKSSPASACRCASTSAAATPAPSSCRAISGTTT